MKILAIDTSCDETCAAVWDTQSASLLSDVVYSHVSAMAVYGGVVPEIASREHLKSLPIAVHQALEKAGICFKDLGWVVATNRPGLIGALMIGLNYAKSLAYSLKIPFSALDHIESHVFSPRLSQNAPPFPWVSLVISGGHSDFFYVEEAGNFKWLGGSSDDAAGEAFDKIGKLLGFEYPAGPAMDQWLSQNAKEAHRKKFNFPIARTEELGFSFSGLKTAVSLEVQKHTTLDKLSIAASAQEAILNAIVDRCEKAKKKFPKASLVITGGVACNSRLRELLPQAFFPEPKHCTDNAAMVANLARLKFEKGLLSSDPLTTTVQARTPLFNE